MTTHLTEEQCHDVWLGCADTAVAAHAASCRECGAQIRAVERALGDFRLAAQSWTPAVAAAPTPTRDRLPRWVWGAGLALAVLWLVVMLPRTRTEPAKAVPEAAIVQAQIARDNLLLARIDAEVGENTPQPLQPLQVNP